MEWCDEVADGQAKDDSSSSDGEGNGEPAADKPQDDGKPQKPKDDGKPSAQTSP